MGVSLKLISLNIERSLQLERVLPFLREQRADVVCLQEVFERDIPALSEAIGATSHLFAPMSRYVREDPPELMGVAIFSQLPMRSRDIHWYAGNPTVIPELDQQNSATWNNKNFPLACVEVEKDGALFKVGNVHHTWTPDGKATELQRTHTRELLRALESSGEFVLCGDFNAPRGGEIFDAIAGKYKDNVPADITSSLDPELHRAKGLELVVDSIFSTPRYKISDFEMISGVSDHKALLATVSKVT